MSELQRDVDPRAGRADLVVARDPDEQDVGYSTRLLAQTLFPYRKPNEDKVVRQNGPLQIAAHGANGLPYGKYPRLIMVYLCTEAVKRRDLAEDEARRIPLGASMQQFLHDIGIAARATGGKAGTIGIVHEQLRRLASTSITAERMYGVGTDSAKVSRTTIRNIGLFDSMDFWITPNPAQPALSEPYLELTAAFYREITEHPVPVDLNILKALGKPRAIDLYLWATLRKHSLNWELVVSWEQVRAQFGPEVGTSARARADFKKEITRTVERILQLWPEAGLRVEAEGLILPPGQPSIARRRSPRE